jgi:hypothetical protein
MPKFKNREEYERWKETKAGTNNERETGNLPGKGTGLVLFVGLGFIFVSCIMIVSGLSGLTMSIYMHDFLGQFQESMMQDVDAMPEDLPLLFSVLFLIFRHSLFFSCLFLLISVFVLVSGIFFLKRKPWARTGLEVFSWTSIALITWFTLLWVFMWAGESDSATGFFGAGIGIIVMLFYAAVPIAGLFLLRHGSIRKEFNRGN